MLEFLPETVKDALRHLNLQFVYELRLRADKPTTVFYKDKYQYLGVYGVTEHLSQAIRCDLDDIAECVFRAGEYSVYSVEEQIKQGFITAKYGERIGLSGEYVFQSGKPHALRNFTSLCVRVPHEIQGAGEEIYEKCFSDGLKNVLIASPPGQGKTTILRDLSRLICEKTSKNVLVCDERGEIASGDVGISCDVLKFADKATAFDSGIRAMRPDVIITDELSRADCAAVRRAIDAGVYVLASAHFLKIEGLEEPFLGLFDRYVFLDDEKIGGVVGIYDGKGEDLGK